MAVTRIKNNQITDATITGSKFVANTITGGLLEDNMTYGSNLTVSGNLTVNGTTTTVDTTNTLIADPLLVLSRGESGTPSADSGILVERGTSTNVAFIWDESADVFAAVNTTDDGSTAGDITISSYANIKAADLEGTSLSIDNIDVDGNSITSTDTNGDINLTPDGTGEVVAATLAVSDLTSGRVVLAGTSGAIEDSGNLTFNGSTLAVTGAVTVSTTLGVTGESTLASAIVSDLTDNRVVIAGTGGALEDDANFTFNGTTLALTAGMDITGDLDVDNININGNTISSTDTNGNISITPDGTGEVVISTLAVTDLTSGRVPYVTTDDAITDSANLTFDGTTLTATKITADNISIDGDTISSAHTTITIDPATSGAGGTVVIAGNLQVTGTTTTIDSTVVTVADPVFQIGASASDDNLDRGIKALYNNSGAKVAFFGMDDTNQEFIYIADATDSSSVFSGSLGSAAFGSLRVTDLTDNRVLIGGTSGEIEDSSNLTFDGTTLTVTGDAAIDNITIDGNTVSTSTGDLTLDSTSGETTVSDNLTVSGTFDVTGATNLNSTTGSTSTTTGALVVDGGVGIAENTYIGGTLNVTGESTLASATVSDLTSGRVVLAGTSGALEDSGNLTFSSNTLTVSGSAVVDNVTVDGNSITSSDNLTFDAAASGAIVVNEAGADVDIRMEASGQANALFIEGSTGNIGIRTATPTGDVALHINTTTSMIPPGGTTAQRPSSAAEGMMRYNSSTKAIEFYNGTEWKTAGSDFTIITADDFSGDGSTVAFTLSEDATSAGLIVALNGVVQDPGTAYSVSGTTLTFTEAPASGDNIDARIITTTTSVTEITDQDTSLTVNDSAGTATATINGSAIMQVTATAVNPGANVTYDLGSTSLQWNTIYGKATSAQYADLAENYTADAHYEAGTVVSFGGDAEVTVTDVDADRKVAGVVSTDPAHLMNSGLEADHVVALALQGRVPCKVTGEVAKGDLMVAAGNGFARAEADPKVGAVIGKALEAHAGGEGVIEVAVGRF